jgi:adenylate kinase family enzyme
MKNSEIKIKQRDLMSAQRVAELFRRIADQIEKDHTFVLDGYPITIASQVRVRQEFKKEHRECTYSLKLSWEEELADQPNLDDESGSEEADVEQDHEHDRDGDDLPEPGVPSTPLDLPGSEDRPRIRE